MNLKYFASALLGVAVIMGPSFATAQDSDTTKKQIHQFDVFLDPRPKLGSELTHNPTLVKDPTFLKRQWRGSARTPGLAMFASSRAS